MSALRELLISAVKREASDLHLKPGAPPALRVNAELERMDREPLTQDELTRIAKDVVPPHMAEAFEQTREADFSLVEDGVGRFRVNLFHSGGQCHIVARHVKAEVPSFEDLHLPDIVKRIALAPRGIVMVAGTTGSGKSTTLAAIIEHINRHLPRRIVTVEDPVEYVFCDRKSVISQREVGIDTISFSSALKRVLRQDPDVIMIGEMRDTESFSAALAAAETGHLVLTTLHTGTAPQAVPRILDLYPASERDSLRLALSENLRAVLCQRLIPCVHGGVRPALEILINTATVRTLIERNHLEKLSAAIETGGDDGMQSFNQAIHRLILSGEITEQQGMRLAGNPEALRMLLRGIQLDEGRRILSP